jgi:hypothetical protein
MGQKQRISTNIGRDQKISVELQQDFKLLEILSLKLTQKDIYTSLCSDYGVVCGRVTVNNGFGVPNARVSIFIPLSTTDEDDPVISALYPYKILSDKTEAGVRYNLLPARKQHGGHTVTGTFPDQLDILTREEVLEVYEKYYKYTVKTNDAGDFMIWGVPLGEQTIHVDVDLSDMGCFSLRPDDFLNKGFGIDQFRSNYQFKSSTDIDSLPQIITFDKTIEIYPFWGNEDLCEIGITRTDFDLSDQGIKVEPKAYLIGGTFSDNGKMSVNKNCQPRKKMGRKCDLTTKAGVIEAIRFTTEYDENNRPTLEYIDNTDEIYEDGSFMVSLPMNMDYLYTNEFGENDYTNDPNKGIPTSACYRLRLSLDDSGLDRVRTLGNYLVPNIREYSGETSASYAFSTDFADYPTNAVDTLILNTVDGFYTPQDYFYRFTYNKVYSVSSFQGSYFKGSILAKDAFLGIKEIVPTEEEDCGGEIVTPPVNFGVKNYTFQLLIADVLLLLEHLSNLVVLMFFNTITLIFHELGKVFDFWPVKKLGAVFTKFAYRLQDNSQRSLYLITYPECEECNGENQYGDFRTTNRADNFCVVGHFSMSGSTDENNRSLIVPETGWSFVNPVSLCTDTANEITSIAYFMAHQSDYILTIYDSIVISLTGTPFSGGPGAYFYQDADYDFPDSQLYSIDIRDKNAFIDHLVGTPQYEEGCNLYDVPYDERLVEMYYTGTTYSARTAFEPGAYVPGMDVSATLIGGDSGERLVLAYDRESYNPSPASGVSEFSNGVYQIIPGTQSNIRLYGILKEYRRRKRVGKLFCGGIVNYSFIDNWLSGSLYFFQFKSKNKKKKKETLINYCKDIVYYKEDDGRFYYRSTFYDNDQNMWGRLFTAENHNKYYRLGHPTTVVDLGPRDEFIKEICLDEKLDPNCSVSRSIGPSSFQNFGDIMGMAINYRMDTSNNEFDIDNFFDNAGFAATGANKVLDGDLMQLISMNNEVGIDEFDLQSSRYMGYSYQYIDPDVYRDIFTGGTGAYGPLPITLYLDEDGAKNRLCINQPGRLTESSQTIPFYLWDKKARGFGSYSPDAGDDQSWDYTVSGITTQPLQGMTYGYVLSGGTNDPGDKYLLLPITYDFTGLTINNVTGTTTDPTFDVIASGITYTDYDTEYPGFTYLQVTGGTIEEPTGGIMHTRYGTAGTWDHDNWNSTTSFYIRRTEDYYAYNKQILSTPFLFYFGLRSGKTGLDKFISRFGPQGAFPSTD